MNSSRMNRLEELGRVDAEKAYTKKGKRNLRDEKSRIVRELKAEGGKVGKKRKPQPSPGPKAGRPKTPTGQQRQKRKPIAVIEVGKKDGVKLYKDGGMVTVSGRGQGKVMPGRNKKTYIC